MIDAASDDFPDLTRLFSPRSVILVGASARAQTIGRIALDNIATHSRFDGDLFLVNRSRPEIDGMTCYPSATEIPGFGFDIALIVIPAAQVVAALGECAAKGVRFAIVITSGFAEVGAWGVAQEAEMKAIARATGMRIYGPNCPGLTNLNGRIGLNISPSFKADVLSGPIGLVTQGGGLGRAVIQGGDRGYGIGLWGSAGNEVDLDFADLAYHMVNDPGISVAAGIVEGFKSGARFVKVARACVAAGKPLLLLKVGRSAAGIAAAQSHTASLAGEDAVNDAVFRQYGVIRVDDIDELHETAATFVRAAGRKVPRSVCITTFSGGAGTLTADLLAAEGVGLATLSPATVTALGAIAPDFISIGNPVDLTTQIFAEPDLHVRALDLPAQDQAIDAIVLPIPADYGAITARLAEDIATRQERHPQTLFVPIWMSERHGSGYDVLQGAGIPPFRGVRRAARALRHVARFDTIRTLRHDTVPANRCEFGAAPPATTDEYAAKAWLASWGVPMARESFAPTPEAAGAAGEAIGGRVALKIVSADILHKTEIGGVTLGLCGRSDIERAATAMWDRVGTRRPEAQLEGFLVSEMVEDGIEMVVGVHRDATFGPILTIGFGGILVEILHDVVHLHLPVSPAEVAAALEHLRGKAVLYGVRGRPAIDRAALISAIVSIANAADAARDVFAEIEVNPLIARPQGQKPVAVDALLRRP